MTRLSELIDRLYLVIRVNAVVMLSLLGLMVAGVGPASCAAAEAFTPPATESGCGCARCGPPTRRLGPANLRICRAGGPGRVAVDAWLMATGALEDPVPSAILGSLAAVSAGWATSSLATIATSPRVRRQDLLVTWRLALLLPGVLLLRAISLVVLLTVWLLLCSLAWQMALLLGAGVAINIAVAMFAYRIRALLEDLHAQQGAAV